MDHRKAGRYWDASAEAWTTLARAGYDMYRDHVNTPAFLRMLPVVRGLRGLDIGCGEGHNTRCVAALGAAMTAIDISPTFAHYAAEAERSSPVGIRHAVSSALELPFRDATFDFAVAFMSLHVPGEAAALREACRVIRSGGFLQFSICHPCFDTPHRRVVRDDVGREIAVEVGDYFREITDEVDRWVFGAAPQEVRDATGMFELPRHHRTLSQWLNAVIDAGFVIERVGEPRADEATAAAVPAVSDTNVVAYFLHILCRKPAAG